MTEPTIVHRCPVCHRTSGEHHLSGCPQRGDDSMIPFPLLPFPVPLKLIQQPEPPVDTWMAPYTDEMQNSLVATGALWMILSKVENANDARVTGVDHNAINVTFNSRLLRGDYKVTIEQVRLLPDDEPF